MNLLRKGTLFLVAALLAFAAMTSEAQELRGRIVGVVRDNTGGVLPGVTVTASGPALIQPQVTTTGEDGSYRLPALPTGLYTIMYELSGFQTLRREAIRVGLNVTLTIDIQLQLAAVQEVLTITGESPVVDVKSSGVGTSFTEELLEDIPNARDIWAAMSQTPGFQMTAYDVGGSHTGTQTGFQTYGYGGQNKTLLEGINVTEGQDANAGYFDFGSFEEFQIGGSGNMGEMTGPGAFFNLTIKSGGDEFHGDVYFDYEGESTISDNVPAEFSTSGGTLDGFKAPAGGLVAGNPITMQYDFNVGGGGPIVKGKAWFYAGYRDNNQDKTILGLPGTLANSQLINYTLKGTYQVNSKNQIIGFFNQRTKFQNPRGVSLSTPPEAALWQASKNRPVKVEWTSVLTDRAFLDVQFSHWGNYFPLYPTQTQTQSVDGVPPARVDLATGQYSGSSSYYHNRITIKPQLSGSLAYYKDNLKGTHNFKVGFEYQKEKREFLRFLGAGETVYRDRSGVPVEVEIWNTPNSGINETPGLGIYAQDAWTLGNRLTLNLGFRFDHYSLGWPEQSFTPNRTDIFQAVSTPVTTVATFNSISPRLGFAYDLTGRGKTVLKAYFGQFYYNPSTDISDLENPVGAAARRYVFTDLNGNRVLDAGELGRQLSTRGGAGFVRVDRDIKHAYGQEASVHFEHELMENFSARASYVYKNQRNGWSEVDIARVNAYTIPFAYQDLGPDNVRGTGDDQVINIFDRSATAPSDRVYTTTGNVSGVPANEGDYHTVEFGIHRRFTKNWLLMTSFEQTWADDFRGVTSGTGSTGVARMGQSFLWRPNQRRFGAQGTSYWNYKLVGRYVFPYEIGVSGSYKLQTGYNITRTISVPLPGAGSENIGADLLEADRGPNVGIVDFRIEKSFALGGKAGRVTGLFDVFNLTNSSVITNFRLTSGTRYNEVIALLDPRIVRFGIRYEF